MVVGRCAALRPGVESLLSPSNASLPLLAPHCPHCRDPSSVLLDRRHPWPPPPAQLRARLLLPMLGADLFVRRVAPRTQRRTLLRRPATRTYRFCLVRRVPWIVVPASAPRAPPRRVRPGPRTDRVRHHKVPLAFGRLSPRRAPRAAAAFGPARDFF